MKELKLEITLLSDALIASGEGFGALIDSDILFDPVGLPYIPARRLKGCLHDCAQRAENMLNDSQIALPFSIADTFGQSGQNAPAPVYFADLKIKDYTQNFAWLAYLQTGKAKACLSKELVMDAMTVTRHQIQVTDAGVTQPHSLRTLRAARKGLVFAGTVRIFAEEQQLESILNTLSLACRELEELGLGAKRTRGLGLVQVQLQDDTAQDKTQTNLLKATLSKVERLCTV